MTPQEAQQYNLDAAQREIDSRQAEGEDMSRAYIADDLSIKFLPLPSPATHAE